MKILELGKFYPPHHGGVETLLRSCAEGFVRLGAQVDCVVANDHATTVRQTICGAEIHRYASFGTLLSTSLCPSYLSATKRYPADLWHAHFPNPLADIACLRGSKDVPLVLSYHSDVIRQAWAMGVYKPLLKKFLDRCTRIVVATPKHFEFSPWLQPYEAKVECIPYGIDLDRFQLTPQLQEAAQKLRASANGKPIILNIGRLVGYKGQEYLIEAARGLDAVVWIVGTGPLELQLKAQAEAAGYGERIRFFGSVPDEHLPALLHACDVFAFPSISPNEAFGLVQVEAMACAKPVVCCNLRSGVPFVNAHERTGLVVPPANADALREALRELTRNPERAAAYGQAGKLRAETEFSEPVMVQRYWQCFQKLLKHA